MLDDRDQTRASRSRFAPRWTVTAALIALNVGVFLLQNLAVGRDPDFISRNFALSVDGLRHGHIWQLVTFQFLHAPLSQGGIFHLLGNLYVIHLFGYRVERALGTRRFLGLCFASGFIGGLMQMSAGMLAPWRFGQTVVGASAIAMGLLAAYATLYPRRAVHLFFLPFAVRADVLFSLSVCATLVGLFMPAGQIAHCAHLGGIMSGFVMARRQFLPAGELLNKMDDTQKSAIEIAALSD